MNIDYVSIRRLPFSRADVVRALRPSEDRALCAWCGRHARFSYGVVDDNGRARIDLSRAFCCAPCYYAFNGIDERRMG